MSRFNDMTNAEIDVALHTAQALSHEADELHRQAYGGMAAGGPPSGGPIGVSGRVGYKELATSRWRGEARDEFETGLFAHEMSSLDETVRRLRDEADDWAGYWQYAINERARGRYEEQMDALDVRRADWTRQLEPGEQGDPPDWYFRSPQPPAHYPRPVPPEYNRPAPL